MAGEANLSIGGNLWEPRPLALGPPLTGPPNPPLGGADPNGLVVF